MYLILLGAPGTGKGTQASILAERFDWRHISTGEMLRDAVAAGTELGRAAKEYMDEGALVRDELVIKMLIDRISIRDAQAGFVLDGFPRNLAQAVALDAALAKEGKKIKIAINIVVPDEELVRRVSGRWICSNCGAIYHLISHPPLAVGECDDCGSRLIQRDDDKPEPARTRLERQRVPADLLTHYREAGKLVGINGSQPVASVTADLVKAVAAVPEKAKQS